jgi:hypothetical protein
MKNLLYLLIIPLLISCDPTVVFLEPQPAGKRDLKSFPSRYRAAYLENDDSSIFIVQAERILEKHEEYLADPVQEILEDDELELTGDSLFMKDMNQVFPVLRKNDSVFGHIVLYDTVFDILGEGKLRKQGKNYLLNIPGDSLWIVLKLNFAASGNAYLCDIDYENEMDLIRKHCHVETLLNKEGDPKKYILAPTRREFRTLLKLQTFTDTAAYTRIPDQDTR